VLEVFSTCRIFKHWCTNRGELRWVNLSSRARISIWGSLVEKGPTTCRGNSVQGSIGWSGHRRSSNCRVIVHVIVTSWPRIFTHLLHFLHVRESLLGWVKAIWRIFFLEAEIFLILLNNSRISFLKSESKSWLGCIKTSWRSLVLSSFLIVACISHHAIVVGVLESSRCGTKYSALVLISLVFVVLDCLEESTSPHLNVLVFNWDHLVEVDRLPLVLWLGSLVLKPNGAWAERLQVVSSAQLVVEHFQLVLDLGIVLARARVYSLLFGYLLHKVSLHWRLEWVGHVNIRRTEAWSYLLENSLFLLFSRFIYMIFIWGWWVGVSWIPIWHSSHVSLYKTISLGIWSKLSKITALS